MATVLITGGTGLIGKALCELLTEKGYEVIILTREAGRRSSSAKVSYAQWNIGEQTIDAKAVERADYIVHLAGEGIADKRWTEKRKKEIRESRISGSDLLIKALREIPNRVKAIISASGIGWYSEDPEVPNTRPYVETDPPDFGFLGETCKLWEESIQPVTLLGKRLVKMRTGIVLSKKGGAFAEFIKPVRFGVAGILGNGKQVISWIHVDDLCRMYLDAIENESLFGPYNAVAPKPVNNKTLILQIAKTIKGNFYLPMHVPSFALRMILGGVSMEVLKSSTVSCEKIRITGFNFIFPSIESAVNNLLQKS